LVYAKGRKVESKSRTIIFGNQKGNTAETVGKPVKKKKYPSKRKGEGRTA